MKTVRIRSYSFPGPAPRDLDGLIPDSEEILDGEARLLSRRDPEYEMSFEYEPDGNLQKKTVYDLQGMRETWTYEYDPEGGLCHIHMTRQREIYDRVWAPSGNRFDEDALMEILEYVPTGETFDEWYDWQDGGRTCRRHFRSTVEDDGIGEGSWVEKRNDKGQLMEVAYESEPGHLFPLEVYSYQDDGSIKDLIRSLPDEEKGHVFQRVLFDDRGRKTVIREKGKPDRRFEYRDHESGLWERRRELDPQGWVVGETVRVFEVLMDKM